MTFGPILLTIWMGGFKNGEKHAYVIKVWPLSLIQAKSAKVRSQLYDLQSRVSIIINSEPLMHALSHLGEV